MNTLPLQSVLPKKVYLNNIVIGRHRDASFFIDNKKYNFYFTFPYHNYQPTVFLKIKLSDHLLWLSLENLPPLSYFSKEFEEIQLDQLPQDIQTIVLEACFKKVLDVVEEELGVVVSIESYTTERSDDVFEDELQFSIKIEGVETPIYGAIHMEGASLEFLAALLERSSYSPINRLQSLEIALNAIIAEESLKLSEIKNLKPNDIILLHEINFINNGTCKIVIGNQLIFNGILKNGIVTLGNLMDERINDDTSTDAFHEFEEDEEEIELMDEEEMEPEATRKSSQKRYESEDVDESQGELPKEFSDLPIRVVFEVGQKRLSLKDLQSIKTGYTFELESSIEHPITIRANGRAIASGELLKVGDRIGVRVTSFIKK